MIVLEDKKLSGELTPEQIGKFSDLWRPLNHAENRYPCQNRQKLLQITSIGVIARNFSRWSAFAPNFYLSPTDLIQQINEYCPNATEIRFMFKKMNGILYVCTNEFDRFPESRDNRAVIEQFRWEVRSDIAEQL